MGESVYWIWLQKVLGFANRNTDQVLEFFKDPKELFKASNNARRECIFLSRGQREKAADSAVMDEAIATYEKCRELGIQIITPEDELYPKRLYDICDHPAVLYCKGEMPEIDDNVVLTIVGTRKASADGKLIASALAQSLAQCGAVIMSGGARGIDDASHQGALRAGAVTVSVLGCGLDVDYNQTCEETRKSIVAGGGALLSEFPPGFAPSRTSFPIRNRLLAAMSLGVIVGEAPAKSGSLITARHAVDMGRDLYAIPGSVMSELSEAANMMIRDGAKPVSCAFDVLEEYNARYPHRLKMKGSQIPISQLARNMPEFVDIGISDRYACVQDRAAKTIQNDVNEKLKTVKGSPMPLPDGVSEIASKLYALLSEHLLNLEELCAKLSIPAHRLLAAMTELEVAGVISSDSQRKYFINKQ